MSTRRIINMNENVTLTKFESGSIIGTEVYKRMQNKYIRNSWVEYKYFWCEEMS